MPVPKRLGALTLIDLQEHRVAIRQHHHKERHLAQTPCLFDQRMTKVHLRFPRWMRQRHEHLAVLLLHVFDQQPNRRVATGVTVLLTQALKDALGSVPLLGRQRLVLFEDLTNPLFERPDLALRPLPFLPVARRLAVLQHLLERFPVHPGLPLHLATAHSLNQYPASYLVPLLHIREHPPGLTRDAALLNHHATQRTRRTF